MKGRLKGTGGGEGMLQTWQTKERNKVKNLEERKKEKIRREKEGGNWEK